jgi:hypothetical protein
MKAKLLIAPIKLVSLHGLQLLIYILFLHVVAGPYQAVRGQQGHK